MFGNQEYFDNLKGNIQVVQDFLKEYYYESEEWMEEKLEEVFFPGATIQSDYNGQDYSGGNSYDVEFDGRLYLTISTVHCYLAIV